MKKRLAILLLAGMMAVSVLSGCGSLEDKDTVATVDGDKIPAGLANFYARMVQAQYETSYAGYMGGDIWSGDAAEGSSYEETVKDQIMEDLQNMYLLEDHMKEYDVEVTEEDERAIQEAAEAFDEKNGLEEKEKVSGSLENVKRLLTLMNIRQKVGDAIRAEADTEVSDEEAAQKAMKYVMFSYHTQSAEGENTELTDSEKEALKEEADAFAAEAKGAEDFAAFAAEKGYEAKDATFDAEENLSIPAELSAAADVLEEGGVTDAVETENGLYVAKVTSLFDEEATAAEKQNIISERQQAKYDETVDAWRKDAEISVEKNVWKKVDFEELGVTMYVDESKPYEDEVQTDDRAEEDEEEDAEEEDLAENGDEGGDTAQE